MQALKSLALLALSAALAPAAGPSIGFAVANGGFQIDSARVSGNATLFDGTAIRTAGIASDLVLSDGARLRLAPGSEARVYRDRLVLSGGHARLAASAPFSVDALGFRVRPGSPGASLDVAVRGPSLIEVAAVHGDALVTSPNGALVARVPAGSALGLEPQAAGAAAPTQISGTLRLSNGAYTVTDTVSNVTFVLGGNGLDQFVNQCVNVTGSLTPAAADLPTPLRVLSIAACGKPVAAAAPQGKGIGARSKVLIAGVAVGATAATIGIAGDKKDKKPKPSRDK